VAVLAESELGSEAQRERRKRILDATMAIASKGGYEAVQMRAVADRADVAVGTLYRYFPSKVHLLVSALGREFERIDAKTDRASLTGGTPYQRLSFMVSKLNRAMQRNPLLTEAMTRAYVFADASAAGEVDHAEKIIDSMFARAMGDGEPTEEQYHIARVISNVWTSNLLAWLTRRASATDVSKRLDLAVAAADRQRRQRPGLTAQAGGPAVRPRISSVSSTSTVGWISPLCKSSPARRPFCRLGCATVVRPRLIAAGTPSKPVTVI